MSRWSAILVSNIVIPRPWMTSPIDRCYLTVRKSCPVKCPNSVRIVIKYARSDWWLWWDWLDWSGQTLWGSVGTEWSTGYNDNPSCNNSVWLVLKFIDVQTDRQTARESWACRLLVTTMNILLVVHDTGAVYPPGLPPLTRDHNNHQCHP